MATATDCLSFPRFSVEVFLDSFFSSASHGPALDSRPMPRWEQTARGCLPSQCSHGLVERRSPQCCHTVARGAPL